MGFILTVIFVCIINPFVDMSLKENTTLYDYVAANIEVFLSHASENVDSLLPRGPMQLRGTLSYYHQIGSLTDGEYLQALLTKIVWTAICLFITLLIVGLLVTIIKKLLLLFVHLPVIHQADKAAGGIVGACKGAVVIFVAMFIIRLTGGTQFSSNAIWLMNRDVLLNRPYSFVNDISMDRFESMLDIISADPKSFYE